MEGKQMQMRLRMRMGKNVRAGRDARLGEARRGEESEWGYGYGECGASARSRRPEQMAAWGADKVSGAPANRRAPGNLSLDKVSNPQLLFSEDLLRPL